MQYFFFCINYLKLIFYLNYNLILIDLDCSKDVVKVNA